MGISTAPPRRKPSLSLRLAVWIVLLIWLAYTALYTLRPSDVLAAVLEFLPGVLAVATLVAAGLSLQACHLRTAPISRTGLVLLAASSLVAPVMWLTGRWTGWNAAAALIYAPASGASQELFFRAALLPALLAAFEGRPFRATVVHALLFALWHVPTAYTSAPVGGLIAVTVVTFACGLLWGEQVRRDGTVFWLMGLHTLLLIGNSFFTWE